MPWLKVKKKKFIKDLWLTQSSYDLPLLSVHIKKMFFRKPKAILLTWACFSNVPLLAIAGSKKDGKKSRDTQ